MKNKSHQLAFILTAVSTLFTGFVPLQAKDLQEKVKKGIDDISEFFKKEVDHIAGDAAAVQAYFDHYTWKGIIEDHTTIGVATLSHLQLNGHPKAAVVRPGEKIDCEVKCFLDPNKCSALNMYRVVVGLKGVGPQTTLCNYLGASAGKSHEKFTLTAPTQPGIYQVRFRVAESFKESDALHMWNDAKGQEPDRTSTIGLIMVKQ